MSNVLVVDDEKTILEDLKKHLEKKNYDVFTASSVAEARKFILGVTLDYAVIDLRLHFMSKEFGGIDVVNYAKRNQPKIKTIILTGYPFEYVETEFKKVLKGECDPGKILKEIEENYIYKGKAGRNYIEVVLEKLEELGQRKEEKNCFVIMPFSETESCTEDEWSEIYSNVIRPAVEEAGFNYKCFRANLLLGSIIEHILDNLNRSELVIADITDRNPNVLYELGVRHALGGATIVISQNENDVPFDLKPYIVRKYGWRTGKEKNRFKEIIRDTIAFVEDNPNTAVSPVQKYLNPIEADSK